MQGKSLSIMLLYNFPETDKDLDDEEKKKQPKTEQRK